MGPMDSEMKRWQSMTLLSLLCLHVDTGAQLNSMSCSGNKRPVSDQHRKRLEDLSIHLGER